MDDSRRVDRIHTPSLDVKIRRGFEVEEIELWREDHFEVTTQDPTTGSDVTQRWLVLDFGLEERAQAQVERDDRGLPTGRFITDDDGTPIVDWVQTGIVKVELQRVNDKGAGMALPVTKAIQPVDADEYDTGWAGWGHVADSPRRPVRDEPAEALDQDVEAVSMIGVTDLNTVDQLLLDHLVAYLCSEQSHTGLSVNGADRRCVTCDEPWPCAPAMLLPPFVESFDG